MPLTDEQLAALKRPFAESEIEWRIGRAGKSDKGPWAMVLAYVDGRAVMDRLDEVFGVCGWSHTIREIALGDAVGVVSRLEAGGAVHEDVAECSDIEALKGAASGSLKRVAVHLGIGRYLYDLEEGWAKISPNGKHLHSAKDKKSNEVLTFRWDPPTLPAWALPPRAEKTAPPAAPALEEGLVVPDGLPDEFLAGVRKILKTANAGERLAKQYSAAAEKARALGADVPLVLAPNLSSIAIANEVMRVKSIIIQLESRAAT